MAEVIHSAGSYEYFACRLEEILALEALSVPEQEYPKAHGRRHAELLTCLTNARDERLTYDLRIIAHPNPSHLNRGRLTIALLCRLDGFSPSGATRHAHNVLHLLQSLFDEYRLSLAPADEIPNLLEPFPNQYLSAITRRAGPERLDTLKIGTHPKRVGFIQDEATCPVVPAPTTVFHLFPFVPTGAPFLTVFRQLLLGPAPVALSCRLQPTTLTPDEEAILEEQIAQCECAVRSELHSASADLSILQPTLREQAQIYQRYQTRLLYGLKDNAGVMTFEIASPEPIPEPLLDTVGGLITQPAGGMDAMVDGALFRFLSGGYQICDCTASASAIDSFRRLDITLPTPRGAPRGAERLPYLFDAVEAAAAFRLPPATRELTAGLEVRRWRTHPAPKNLSDKGCLIGINCDRGPRELVRIADDDRRRHVYLVGQTGTGKTTLLKTMILDDMRAGRGLCVIDPHGDLFEELVGHVPEDRIGDVVLLDPTDIEHPIGLNMLESRSEAQRYFLVQEIAGIMARLIEDEFGTTATGQFTGPIFFQHLRMNLLLAMSRRDDPATLLEFYTIFQQKDYWHRWMPLAVSDPLLERWVANVLPKTDYLKTGYDSTSLGSYLGSKFEGFVFDPMLRRIFGQKRSTIDLRTIMDNGQILLVNLAKGELTELNSRFVGMVLLAKLQAASIGRGQLSRDQRRDFTVYVDEFQSIATQNFVSLLSEGRKFGVNLVLANQFVSQIRDTRIMDAIFGNVGTLVAFRLGQTDAEIVEKKLFPVFTRFDLVNLPNWHAYVSTLANGAAVQPFSLQTVIEASVPNPARANAVLAHSREAYARPSAAVDAEIARSLL